MRDLNKIFEPLELAMLTMQGLIRLDSDQVHTLFEENKIYSKCRCHTHTVGSPNSAMNA